MLGQIYQSSWPIGNHDTFFKNTNQVNSMDCLRMMMNGDEGDGMVRIYHEPTEVVFDGTKVFFQPWICPENKQQSLTPPRQIKFCLVILKYKGLR